MNVQILKQTENEIHIQGKNRVLKYWIHGIGLIPIHPNPSLTEDTHYRGWLKDQIFGNRDERRTSALQKKV